jgi:hypothetical protein
LKVDFMKAYNSVLAVLKAARVPEVMVRWIKKCITTPRFSIWISDGLKGFSCNNQNNVGLFSNFTKLFLFFFFLKKHCLSLKFLKGLWLFLLLRSLKKKLKRKKKKKKKERKKKKKKRKKKKK